MREAQLEFMLLKLCEAQLVVDTSCASALTMVDLYQPKHFAFRAGVRAYYAGKPYGANPYRVGTLLSKFWIRGYLSAMNDETLKGKP